MFSHFMSCYFYIISGIVSTEQEESMDQKKIGSFLKNCGKKKE